MTSTVPTASPANAGRTFFGQPVGLATLFFTEMWERFSYYGMRALLILFMTAAPAAGGLGFDAPAAGAIYGLYTSMVYMMSLPGGWIADKLIGQRRAVLYGGILIASGHFTLAFSSTSTFYLGLLLIVLGTGLLKPNISTIVGQLYAPGDNRRDAGFSIFYMGINTGAFIAPLICGYLGQRVSWHVGFGAAGVGMALGIVQYLLGGGTLGDAGLRPVVATPAAAAANWRMARNVGLPFAALIVLAPVGALAGWWNLDPVAIADGAGYLLLATTFGFFAWLYASSEWTPEERKRLYVVGVLFVAAVLFWALFEQAGSTLNLFADRNTRHDLLGFEFPSSWLQSVQPLCVILFAPVFAWIWLRLGPREPSTPVKFSLGLLLMGLSFVLLVIPAGSSANGARVSPLWLMASFVLSEFGELCLSPVGLSAMTKLAPARIGGLMMGAWFLTNSAGNYISGRISGFYESFPLTGLFGLTGLTCLAVGVVLLAIARPLARLMGGVK